MASEWLMLNHHRRRRTSAPSGQSLLLRPSAVARAERSPASRQQHGMLWYVYTHTLTWRPKIMGSLRNCTRSRDKVDTQDAGAPAAILLPQGCEFACVIACAPNRISICGASNVIYQNCVAVWRVEAD